MIRRHFSSSADYRQYAQRVFNDRPNSPEEAEKVLTGDVKINGTLYEISFPPPTAPQEILPPGAQQIESRAVTAAFRCMEGEDTTIKERTAHDITTVLTALSVKSRHRDRTVPAASIALFSQPPSPPTQPTAPPFYPTRALGVDNHSATTMPITFNSITAFRRYIDQTFENQPLARAMQIASGPTTIYNRKYQISWPTGEPDVTTSDFSSGLAMADFMHADNSIHGVQEILRVASESRATPFQGV